MRVGAVAVGNRRRAGCVAAWSLLFCGCGAAAVPFEPVNPSEAAAGSYPAARIELRSGERDHAVVWSEGATDEPAPRASVLDIEVRIDNSTNDPRRFDLSNTFVHVETYDGRSFRIGSPTRRGSDVVPPRSSSRVSLGFTLPSGIGGSRLARFDFEWSDSTTGSGRSTRFVPVPPPYTDDVNGRAGTCLGPYGFSTTQTCKDAITQVKR